MVRRVNSTLWLCGVKRAELGGCEIVLREWRTDTTTRNFFFFPTGPLFRRGISCSKIVCMQRRPFVGYILVKAKADV